MGAFASEVRGRVGEEGSPGHSSWLAGGVRGVDGYREGAGGVAGEDVEGRDRESRTDFRQEPPSEDLPLSNRQDEVACTPFRRGKGGVIPPRRAAPAVVRNSGRGREVSKADVIRGFESV